MSNVHLDFAKLYGSRDHTGEFRRGPYFNRVLSLGVRLGLTRAEMKRIANRIGVDSVEGGLNAFPNADSIGDFDLAMRGATFDGNGNRSSHSVSVCFEPTRQRGDVP